MLTAMGTRAPGADPGMGTGGRRTSRPRRARAAIAARVLLVCYLLVPVLLTLGPTPLRSSGSCARR